jgi:glycosyltransferase involved in cell wall biosynthesis
MIDIIIPAYNARDTIDQTLSSIAMQDSLGLIKVYIVNDASDYDYQEYVNFYKEFFDITELSYKENMGPGYARKYGIENSSSKYIIFIDSDDVFYDRYAVSKLFNEIDSNNLDFVNSEFYEEIDSKLYSKKNDIIWLHGKIYRREFLYLNNISFNNSRNNEDNGFNILLLLNKPKTSYIDSPTYIWRNNKNSMTRTNNYAYRYTGMKGYIYNIEWAIKQVKNKEQIKKDISTISLASLFAVYCCYIEFKLEKDSIDLIKESKNLLKYSKMYKFSEDEYYDIIQSQFNNLINKLNRKYLLNQDISFNKFLEMIEEMEK